MKTSRITPADLHRSVVAVPPLCRNADQTLSTEENAKLIRHMEAGGIRTLLYGGNANLYHIAVSEYAALLSMLAETAGEETLIVPAVGPMYGTMMDQAAILRDFQFPTAMLLPTLFPAQPAGVATAIRRFVEKAGIPAVLYMKEANYITTELAQKLVDDGLISWIKYAIVREDPSDDPILRDLVGRVDPQLIVSGIGEQPAIIHMRDFGCVGYTAGCVCIAPQLSMNLLAAIDAGDFTAAENLREKFKPLEDLRNAHSPILVLHHAVELAGIAATGAPLPLLNGLPDALLPGIQSTAQDLLKLEQQARTS
ncbi:MAG: dihydrodipicolinate synthase family protein [Verrucomicrobiales bacterium]|nr:dihydrodipicolinate synthase family protein [Verrucomicrobiales bacterium]